MTEVLFYHLQHQPLEAVLPTLLQKTLERGWRAVVQAVTEERMSALDDHLWTFADESFLPHGTDREAHAADQPILITLSGENPNGASIRFLVEGADLPNDIAAYERLAILFDGNDVQALAVARDQWRAVKEGGHAATYWQQDESGRWQRKA
ncbi:DNA polymerase III subunit chi [Microvirga lotononidis]|uniref:DNA polymerase III, chi subunit n=1 Tax=Microvirga lotononidis TaxID=864069 RepID=I4YWI5_9HYPH|nr:DNA polymerase III subunit chi [Microvirga lotononidis]EIM28327.1 DNA polymerase III, chi subunit [Microvirga lotononidis]WQO27582.1 DNA polymerase III subunit chi [Microvirga lotononidis]